MLAQSFAGGPANVGPLVNTVQMEQDGIRHGTASGYSTHRCRCAECKAYKTAIDRARYERNGEAVKARSAAYHKANRDKALAKRRVTYQATIDAKRKTAREYAAANRAAAVERVREWRKLPHAKVSRRLDAHRRRQQKFDAEARAYVRILLDDPCSYCGGAAGTIDHIVPIAAGGDSHWSNLTAACKSCNSRKSDRSLLVFLLELSAPSSTTPVLGTSKIEVA